MAGAEMTILKQKQECLPGPKAKNDGFLFPKLAEFQAKEKLESEPNRDRAAKILKSRAKKHKIRKAGCAGFYTSRYASLKNIWQGELLG
jgi:hypothetical protein